jgi:hypothetical protein
VFRSGPLLSPFGFIPYVFFPWYAPVGSRLPEPCAPVLISSLHIYSRSSCSFLSVVVFVSCFGLGTSVSCTVSLNIDLVLSRQPQSLARSPSARPSPSVPLRVGLANAGSASSSDTAGKPLALCSLFIPLFVFPSAGNQTVSEQSKIIVKSITRSQQPFWTTAPSKTTLTRTSRRLLSLSSRTVYTGN